MKQRFKYILFITIALNLAFQSNTNFSNKRILSEKYMAHDSLFIQIESELAPSCTESFISTLDIHYYQNISIVTYHPYDEEAESLGPIKGSVLADIIAFETKGKKDDTYCGGYVGGNGVSITMRINKKETNFSYCQDDWDGMGELLNRLKARRKPN